MTQNYADRLVEACAKLHGSVIDLQNMLSLEHDRDWRVPDAEHHLRMAESYTTDLLQDLRMIAAHPLENPKT